MDSLKHVSMHVRVHQQATGKISSPPQPEVHMCILSIAYAVRSVNAYGRSVVPIDIPKTP